MRVLFNNVVQDKSYKVIHDVKFGIDKIEEYRRLFESFKANGVILNNSFDDDIWVIKTHVNQYKLKFYFDELTFVRRFNNTITLKEFNVSIKAFFLYKLLSRDSIVIYRTFNTFKTACKITSFFDERYIKEFEKLYKIPCNIGQAGYVKEFLFDFFSNYNIIDDKYYRKLEGLCIYKKTIKQRELPSFESMFKLDEIIDDFYENRDGIFKDIKEKYFPIVLWWKITSIIPLRTLEFTVIPYNCVDREKTNTGYKYTITLNRSISKGGIKKSDISRHSFDKCFKPHTIETTEEIYNLVKEYQSMVDYYDDIKGYFYADEPPVKRRFLLSYRSYFNQFPDNIKKRVRRKKEDLDYFSERPFYILFNDFFEEIVCDIYNKTVISKSGRVEDNSLIHAIQPMDTRHFAIMNMVLSGIEPTIIKELAGHSNIDTTYGYSRHAQEYANNLILSMAKKQSKDGMMDYAANQVLCDDGVQEMTTSKKRYVLARLKDKEYASQFRKVADGYCLYTKDDIVPCILCAGNHKRCSHYIVNESVGFTNLLQEHKDMHKEMNAEIETLNWVISNYDKIENWADRFKASLSKIKSYMNKEVGFRAEYQVFEKFD